MDWYSELNEDESYFSTAKMFVEKQRPAYRFGINQFEADVNWLLWRDKKNQIKPEQKKCWYNHFTKIMNSDLVATEYNSLFED